MVAKDGVKMTLAMETRKFKDLLAIRPAPGRVLAFHSRNLQVARLSEESWEALNATDSESEAMRELREWEESNDPAAKTERSETGVRSLTVNVTQVCNLHCKYCAAGGDGSYGDPVKRIVVEETLPTLKTFIAKVPAGEGFQLTFLGGEPLLYPEGIELLAEDALRLGAEHGVKVTFSVVTNGTQFSEKNIAILVNFRMSVTVSLDGPAVVNDVRRPTKGGRGMTAQIEKGLALLLERKAELGAVRISGVFGRDNLDLMAAYLYFRQFNVDDFDFTYDHHETSEEINREFMSQMAKVAAFAFETEGEKGLRRIHTFERFFRLLDEQTRIENYCGAGKSFLMLDARQNLYTCPWVVGQSQEVVGYGGTTWSHRLDAYQEPQIVKHGCQDCWARHLCGGGCMYINRQVTGDKHRVDTNFCTRTRFLIETTLSYYEQSRETHEKGETNEAV